MNLLVAGLPGCGVYPATKVERRALGTSGFDRAKRKSIVPEERIMMSDERPFEDGTTALCEPPCGRYDAGPGDDDDDDEVPIGDPPDDDEGDDWDEDDEDDDDEEPLQARYCDAASPSAPRRGTMAPARLSHSP